MSGDSLRTARQRLGLTQHRAAARWRVSQTYLSLMEHGKRPVPVRVARLLARNEPTLATALPLDDATREVEDLPRRLGTLGYPGFRYLADPSAVANPAVVVLAAVRTRHVPARVMEALPWVLVTFVDLDWEWLVSRAKLANLQNRLGYLVLLAREVAERQGNPAAVARLTAREPSLEEARLAKEDTLGRALTDVERRRLRQHRSAAAAHWNLLTDLQSRDLRYGA